MAVLQLMPSRLSYFIADSGYEDDNGDYIQGNGTWQGSIKCDMVYAGDNAHDVLTDGEIVKYSYNVYLPGNCKTFKAGDRVRITTSDKVTNEYTVKSFIPYQLHCIMKI